MKLLIVHFLSLSLSLKPKLKKKIKLADNSNKEKPLHLQFKSIKSGYKHK